MSIQVIRPKGCDHLLKLYYPEDLFMDSRIWTDGHSYVTYVSYPSLLRCPIDGNLFWQEECETVATIPHYKSGPPDLWDENAYPMTEMDWNLIESPEKPTEEDLFRVLSEGVSLTKDQELHLRISLVTMSNHPQRYGECRRITKRHRENRNRLKTLMNREDLVDVIFLAELFREEGEFQQAVDLLRSIRSNRAFSDDLEFHMPWFEKVLILAEDGVDEVAIYQDHLVKGKRSRSSKLTGF
jgi:hypothetical protein